MVKEAYINLFTPEGTSILHLSILHLIMQNSFPLYSLKFPIYSTSQNIYNEIASFENITISILFEFLNSFYLFKGCTVTSVREEKLYNPRLTKSKEEFVNIMENLGLAKPKKIGIIIELIVKHCV